MRNRFLLCAALAVLAGCGRAGGSLPALDSIHRTAQSQGSEALNLPYFPDFPALPPRKHVRDQDIDQNIDSDVQGADRDTLRSVMLMLPEDHRNNVVYLDHGRALANHRALLMGAKSGKIINGEAVLSDGSILPMPPNATEIAPKASSGIRSTLGVGPNPPTSDTMGPFHRTYSVNGYTYVQAGLSLPCNASPFMSNGGWQGPYRDTGYLYFAAFTSNDDAEGGLYYKASATTNYYVPYQTDYSDGAGWWSPGDQYALVCGQQQQSIPPLNRQFTMDWLVDSPGILATGYDGYGTSGQIVDLTISRNTHNSAWSGPSCNCTVSTVTSIAQNGGGTGVSGTPGYFPDRSTGYWADAWYFGVDPNSVTLPILWSNVNVGQCFVNGSTSTNCTPITPPGYSGRVSFPNDSSQILTQTGDSSSLWSERVGIGLALDSNSAPLAPQSYLRGQPYPAPTPTPTDPPTKGCGTKVCY